MPIPKGQRKERLVECRIDYCAVKLAEVGHQIVANAGTGVVQCQHEHNQPYQHHEQCRHQDAGLALDAITHATEQHAKHHDLQEHEVDEQGRRAHHFPEILGPRQRVQTAGQRLEQIDDDPHRDDGVEHRNHERRQDGQIARHAPAPIIAGQCREGAHGIALGMPAHGNFRHHHGQTDQRHKQHIDEQKHRAAILGSHDGKGHQIAKAHRRPGSRQDEAESGAELTALDRHEKSFDLNYLVLLMRTFRPILSASLRL
jgi:hypothetical protein